MPRSLWTEPRPPGAPPRSWRDWALAGVFCLLAVLEGLTRPDLPGGIVAVVLVFALAPTLLFRRSHPLLMVVIAFAATLLAPLFTDGVPPEARSLTFLLLLPYSLLRWGSGRDIVIGVAAIAAKMVLSVVASQMTASTALAGAAVTFGVAAWGAAMRYRSSARLRELDRVRIVERERLARDLHDTVAHHVSAMAIRAQAGLAMAPSDPAAATDALRVIEAEASKALSEMRTVVAALRDDLSPRAWSFDGGEPPVDLDVSGDLSRAAPAVGAAVFRMAQEAVTNARRHASHATRIEVRVKTDATAVHLHVTDDGSPGAPAGGGFGLAGMRERAHLLGGTCTAGPNPDRGWTVTATLPLEGPAT
ncbi:sensor histidine kinase [Paractinoplanes globisporus]|uniref:histidine kinase n=1 Tax=Paractinoplanes globisporus TaxID=113565 RepID=A0ABW6WBZ2_9ACTN|nr:histidine kinase [Actinoplanes globisporus]